MLCHCVKSAARHVSDYAVFRFLCTSDADVLYRTPAIGSDCALYRHTDGRRNSLPGNCVPKSRRLAGRAHCNGHIGSDIRSGTYESGSIYLCIYIRAAAGVFYGGNGKSYRSGSGAYGGKSDVRTSGGNKCV